MATESRHLSVYVDRSVTEVCAFVSDPANLPSWAAGVDSTAKVTFAPTNPFGVLDHDVLTPAGEIVHVPLRALPDGDGCEIVFTVRRPAGTSDEDYDRDVAAVTADLESLRLVLETGSGSGSRARLWAGTNAFRLMASDEPSTAPATATIVPGPGGNLVSIAYSWSHPDDGPQDGLLVLGPGADGAAVAFWGDTWHQAPEPRLLAGAVTDGVWTVGYEYAVGEWRWDIVVDSSVPGALRLRMDNTALTGDEPPYAAMDATFEPG